MGTNNSYAGTAHIKAIADAAVMKDEGVTLEFATENEAYRFRMQFNNMRSIERRFSKRLYTFEDPRYGTSMYDAIETRMYEEKGLWYLVLRTGKAILNSMKIIDNKTGQQLKPEDL